MDNETGGHSKLEAFEMWIWRRMERISWTEHNYYIERRSANIGRRGKISYIHNQSKTRKLDGTPAERRLSSERMEGRMEGKRGRGRPRQKLLDWMMSEG